MDMMESDKQP